MESFPYQEKPRAKMHEAKPCTGAQGGLPHTLATDAGRLWRGVGECLGDAAAAQQVAESPGHLGRGNRVPQLREKAAYRVDLARGAHEAGKARGARRCV